MTKARARSTSISASGRLRRSVRSARHRGSVVLIVLWAIAIAAVIVAATQLLAFRTAGIGRESLARVQARWAARAGIEETIAVLEYHTESPDADDAMSIYRDLEAVADGSLASGSWSIRHTQDGMEKLGPQDEAAKANVNKLGRGQLIEMPGMAFDVADSILDWRDADSDVQALGAERDFYFNRQMNYQPRNADFRSLAELELVAGAWPEYVRGEDANLNGRLDPNEDDGDLSPPRDNADGLLQSGWSGLLTAYTTSSKVGASGEERVYLREATADDMKARFGVDDGQASALVNYFKNPNSTMEALLISDLGALASGGGQQPGGRGGASSGRSAGRANAGRGGNQNSATAAVKSLDSNQLRLIFREGTVDDPTKIAPGKINVNTVSAEVMRDVLNLDSYVIDAILNMRASKSTGITSIVELQESSKITPQILVALARDMDTTSSVFTITSRGRSVSTGLEVEITAVVDRSSLPARILEYREQ
jgi:type II secretory pathway component PulK